MSTRTEPPEPDYALHSRTPDIKTVSLVETVINFLGLVSGALSCTRPPLCPGTEHAPEDATSSFAREPEQNLGVVLENGRSIDSGLGPRIWMTE
ncbi:hypothetical protein QIS74_00292 [Colletotrichum tabaci]|uniref:Uncharacterized protein n=1 Tax=Colletotrichum tabaci TaxID=1209068 RepID=A0AAV9TT17_9PEZI